MTPYERLKAIAERERLERSLIAAGIVKDLVSLVAIAAFLFTVWAYLPTLIGRM